MDKKIRYFRYVVFGFFLLSLFFYIKDYYNISKTNEKLKTVNKTEIENNDIENSINDLKINYNNDDIIAVLKIGDIINVPIVKTVDNQFYLHHDIYKKENIIGAVFMDYKNDASDKHINIYGHNARYHEVPFKNLISYMDYDFYKDNKVIELYINNSKLNYKIVNIKTTTKYAREEHLKLDFDSDEKWAKHFDILSSDSLFKIDDKLEKDDNILVLQTCILDKDDDKMLIVVAKLVE